MTRWIKYSVYVILAPAVLLLVFGWLVLAAPFFSDLRRSIVGNFLSQEIGQPLIIEDDVRAFVAPTSVVTVSGASIPSEAIDGVDLAEFDLVEFDLKLRSLLLGGKKIEKIKIAGLRVNLITLSDGATSWTEASQPPPKEDGPAPLEVEENRGLFAFLSDKTVDISAVDLEVRNDQTGFEFLFALESATLEQRNAGDTVVLLSRGTVNSYPFQIEGDFPTGAPFTTTATLGDVQLSFAGERLPEVMGGGFTTDMTLDTGEIGNLLEILKLKRSLEGRGQLSAQLVRQGTKLVVEDFRTVADFDDGSTVSVEGTAVDLMKALDFDVKIEGRFFAEGEPPKRAEELKDLKLVGVEAHLVSEEEEIEIKEILIKTNLFERELEEIGPVSIGRVARTEEGTLALEDIEVLIGPIGSPYITSRGNVADVLGFKDFGFTGELSAPANLVLSEFRNDVVQAFGGIRGAFEVSDASGQLSLTNLEARSENTDLWKMRANASARSVTSVDDLDFELDLEVPDGAAFLEALQLSAVDIGPVGFSTAVEGRDSSVETRFSVSAGESRIDAAVATTVDSDGRPTVRGTIQSGLLNMRDLDKTGEAIVQLNSLNDKRRSDTKRAKREIQPLVLEREEASATSGQTDWVEGGRIVQPLVLDDADAASETTATGLASDGRMIQPLVLDDQSYDGQPSDLIDIERVGRDLDLEIAIEVSKIVGQAGVSKISSKLVSKDGKADLGPLEFSYGGGYFRVGAGIDFINTPQLARVFGATSGWDFGKILEELGVDMQAYGKLRAQFDLTGNRSSARRFVNSMYGSTTISMVNGKIATSLLELAGLGLFQWLFSKELQQGYTDIVCFVAPLRINAGKVTSNSIVVETKSVQLVAKGQVDWRNDRISMRAEPRPVGRPLARSAWPFEVSGRLSSPDFKIGGGSRRTERPTKNRATKDAAPAKRVPCRPDIQQLE